MKRFFPLILFLSFFPCLLFPTQLREGAVYGLTLWYRVLVPSLLPLLLLSGLLTRLSTTHSDSGLILRLATALRLPKTYAVAVLLGLLCGMPIGARLLADQIPNGQTIPLYPLLLCSCLSPGFLTGYVCSYVLQLPRFAFFLWTLFLLLHILLVRTFFLPKDNISAPIHSSTLSDVMSFSNALEQSIASALHSILTIGVYVMVFAIISHFFLSVFRLFSVTSPLFPTIVAGLAEVTTGCSLLTELTLPFPSRLCICMFLVSFGGLSTVFQCYAMCPNHHFPLLSYLKRKAVIAFLLSGIMTALISICYVVQKTRF